MTQVGVPAENHPGSTADSHPPIEAPILDRFGDVGRLDFFRAGKVGDGAADFEHPAIGAGAQAQLVDGGFEQLLTVAVDRAVAF